MNVKNNFGDFEVTVLTTNRGILSKRISLKDDGTIKSDGSECKMTHGRAERRSLAGIEGLGALIADLPPPKALVSGQMRPGIPNTVAILSKKKLLNGGGGPNAITRTRENFTFEPGRPTFVLIDFDPKNMPASVADRLAAAGGIWSALVGVSPGLARSARLLRASTSTGLRRTDTGEEFPGSGGFHLYLPIRDGNDTQRFLTALHERAWLVGFGWIALSKVGSELVRSIVDVSVGTPEHIAFEGAPIVEPPLEQDRESRRPVVFPGETIDSGAVCPSLSTTERAEFNRLVVIAKREIAPERNRIRGERASEIANERKISIDAARRIIDHQAKGLLLSDHPLAFVDDKLANKTVVDVLDDPSKFEDESLADPIEGVDYGRTTAIVMIGSDGIPWIKSHAHGGINYRLKYDKAAVEERIGRASGDVVQTLVSLDLRAELSALELDDLVEVVHRRTGRGVRQIKGAVLEARREQAERARQEARERKRAERNDSRPEIPRPPDDAPLTEEMARINEIVGEAPIEKQLRRDLEGHVVKPRWRPVPKTSAFSGEDEEDAPEQWTIARLDSYGLTEEIERFINYVDEDGRSVAPPMRLVKAFETRDDRVLSVLAAIATQPIVLADGAVLGREKGFDRTRGIHFAVPPAVAAAVPQREAATPEAVGEAMKFLTDDWLVDVKTGYPGKCVAIAEALTIIERSLLPDRPAFFHTAGKSGSGKTTLIKMIIAAVTGCHAAASAWTSNEDERRKAVLAYFMAGVPYILWDNIPRGFQVTCPHIERSCTSAYYADRLLGVSEMVATAASTIHLFTGNNIAPKGDLASRSLTCKLEADRPDPANRKFAHPDPIEWTLANRDKILGAMFTILLGNPKLKEPADAEMKTRFKTWYRLVGSAVENAAAAAAGEEVSFKTLFVNQDDADEDAASLSEILAELFLNFPNGFEAKDATSYVNDAPDGNKLKALLREFLFDGRPPSAKPSSR
jgi:hypothetical protein